MTPAGLDTFGELSSGRIILNGYLRSLEVYITGPWLALFDDNGRQSHEDGGFWHWAPDSGRGAQEEALGRSNKLEVLCLLLQSDFTINRVLMDAITVEPVSGEAGTFRRTGLARLSVWIPNNRERPEWGRIYQKWRREGRQRVTLV